LKRSIKGNLWKDKRMERLVPAARVVLGGSRGGTCDVWAGFLEEVKSCSKSSRVGLVVLQRTANP